jgi:hypothetical protein
MPYTMQRRCGAGPYLRGFDRRVPLTLWSNPAFLFENFFLLTAFLDWSLLKSTRFVSP